MSQRRAGKIQLQLNGEVQEARGNFSYNLGKPQREAIIGAGLEVQGFKESGQVPFIEGEITDRGDLDLAALVQGDDLTVTLELANGKMVALYRAWFAGEGTATTEEAAIAVRWEGVKAEEV